VSKLSSLGTCLHQPHLRRTGSLAVGTWLTLFNQGDVKNREREMA
jgi:hypothetical protein